MSLRAMTWALEHAPVTDPTQALVLIALADRSSDDGRGAYPSQEWLAKRARVSDRSVRRILTQLEREGLIRRGDQRLVDHHPADRRPIVWDLILTTTGHARPDVDDRPDTDDRTPMTERPDAGDRTTGRPRPTNRPRTIPEPTASSSAPPPTTTAPETTTTRGTRLPDGFELTDPMREWAREHTPLVGPADHDRFVDYWRAVPGAKGRKTDWVATWRNWMRKANDDKTPRTHLRAVPGGSAPRPYGDQRTPEQRAHDRKTAWIR